MDIPEDRFYSPAKINAWFAVSAILVLAVTAAAILADHYDRDWKHYQQAFHDLERRRAEEALALRDSSPETAPEAARAVMARLLGVDGKDFSGDARVSFAKAITAAEAAKGALRLLVWRAGKAGAVGEPVLRRKCRFP